MGGDSNSDLSVTILFLTYVYFAPLMYTEFLTSRRKMKKSVRLIRDGDKGRVEGSMEVGEEGGIVYLSLHYHHRNDFCIKMGSDESHFNVSSIVEDKVTNSTVSTDHNF